MARRSQCSSAGDNPLDANYLPPHYREEYRLAIDALVEEDLDGYYQFLQKADVVDFLSPPEIQHIQSCVQVPQQSYNTEQHHFLEAGAGDGSSDTYWPIHSDLDAPGLDLGWPQLHHFIGPTEVTMLVNPPEPDMPSIKEQARRLIKNAQQVVAIVMDMFTDVDMLADILDAAMRNVAVYILLDKQNAHHFVNMVSNCRVNLQSIQLLRVRTVSGITYHCRSGKSIKGQMMDRFLLTDCRAVLSGNYSFMWSFEKLHRCMAHLFLGQLVSTFDEEFRILFAQSHPLIVENFAPMEELSLLQKRPYPGERTLYREPKKFQRLDSAHSAEWPRHSYDDRVDVDWRMMALKKQESRLGPTDVYGRFTPQQTRMDPPFDPGPSRMPMMENLALKRHSYAEGVQGRHSYPFLPQGMPEPENQGRPFHRGPQPGPGPGKELDYGGYDKFWNQDFYSADQYSESGLQQDVDQLDNFDPVLNYLSSTRNVDLDQGSEKLLPASDSPIGSPHMRRLSLDQPRAFQTSPTPSNLTEQKFIQEPNADRKDPMVKRGLRNWRISSYLSAYDNPGDEGLPSAPLNAPDPYEEPSNPIQQTPGIDLSLPKIPNVREFKVPAIPRVSHIPSYAKTTTREQPKKLPDEPAAVAAEAQTTPTPSESSSSAEVEKTEEAAQKEPKTTGLRREESFRRNYNAAVQRSSRLRSSLIFSSLDTSQDTKTALDQQDDESDKNETEQTKLPFVSQILGPRRSTAREPFEWSRYMKSTSADNSATDPSKPEDGNTKQDDKDSAKNKDLKDTSAVQESLKPADEEQTNPSPSMPRAKAPEAELPKTDLPEQPPVSLFTAPSYIDMSDPDNRLVFFKELAAKRKAAKAAEAEKNKEKALVEPPAEPKDTITVKKEEPKETSENIADTSTPDGLLDKNAGGEEAGKTEACESVSLTVDASDKTNRQVSQVKTDPNSSQSRRQEQTRDSADSEKAELKNGQSAAPQSKPAGEPTPSSPALKTSGPAQTAHIRRASANAPSLAQGTDDGESPRVGSTSKEPGSLAPSSVEVPPSSALDSNTQNPESFQLETSISTPPLLPEQHTSKPSGQGSSADHILPDSGSEINPSHSPSSCALPSAPAETVSSKVALEDLSSTTTVSTPDAQESVPPTLPEPSQSTSPETLSAAHSTRVESDISPDKSAAGSEPDSSSSQKKDDGVPESKTSSIPADGEESGLLGSSKDIKADGAPSSLSPSLPESCLPDASDLESKSSQNEVITPAASPAEAPPKHSETSSPDSTPKASQSERRATPPPQLNLTGPVTKAVSCSSSPTQSVGSVLSPEAEKPLATLHSPSDTNYIPKQSSANSSKTPQLPSAETLSPTEPTSKVPAEPDLPCKTPESVTSEPHPSEPPASAANTHVDSQHEVSEEHEMPEPGEKVNGTEATNEVNKTTTQESVCNENTNEQAEQNNCSERPEIASDGDVPPSKQPKSSPSRYQSSTANVLSSSNLRDDTKLLLEQISANSQSRSEAAKESPVTDDEKEDEADKNAKREKQRGIGSVHRGEPKTSQEREKLLEKIQSMRKERKVYSRFEMAP